MTILLEDHFTSLAAWTQHNTWSVSSGTWATALGDASGGTYLSKAMPAGAQFIEVLYYGGATTGDNWGSLKLRNTGAGAVYDANGLGVLFRSSTNGGAASTEMQMFTLGSPTLTSPRSNASDFTPYTGMTWPTSAATAMRVGIWTPNTTDLYVYVNRVLVAKAIGNTAATGTNIQIGSYNSNNGFFDYAVVASSPLDYYDYGLHPGEYPGVVV